MNHFLNVQPFFSWAIRLFTYFIESENQIPKLAKHYWPSQRTRTAQVMISFISYGFLSLPELNGSESTLLWHKLPETFMTCVCIFHYLQIISWKGISKWFLKSKSSVFWFSLSMPNKCHIILNSIMRILL